jgi:hypothetical protein
MEQTLKERLQNKGAEMSACLEFIKLNIRSESEQGQLAQGKFKLKLWKHYMLKSITISLNCAFWIFILYTIFF